MKYTPGPWKFKEEEGDKHGKFTEKLRRWIIDSPSRGCMAIMEAHKYEDDPDVWDEVRANANLIAAAPELLEMLEKLTAWCWKECQVGAPMFCDADALIAKAKGEKDEIS